MTFKEFTIKNNIRNNCVHLMLQNVDIQDLNGINKFTHLTTLDIANNKFTKTPDISKLINLTNLFCEKTFTKTNFPDIRKLKKLVTIYAFDSIDEGNITRPNDLDTIRRLQNIKYRKITTKKILKQHRLDG